MIKLTFLILLLLTTSFCKHSPPEDVKLLNYDSYELSERIWYQIPHGAEALYNNENFMLIEINDMHLQIDKIKKEIKSVKNHFYFDMDEYDINPFTTSASAIVKSFLDSDGSGKVLYNDMYKLFLIKWKEGEIFENKGDTLHILAEPFHSVKNEMDFLYDGSELSIFADKDSVKIERTEKTKVVDFKIEYGEKLIKSDGDHCYIYQFDVEKSILRFYKYRLNKELVKRVDFELNNYFEIYSVNPTFHSFSLDKNIFTFAFNYSKNQDVVQDLFNGGYVEDKKTNIGILDFEINF